MLLALFTLGRGYIDGLKLANNGADLVNDIDVAAGACRDSTDAIDIRLVTGITKQLNAAWAVGTAQGGLDTGAIADATYHVWLIKRADTGVVDALFSTSTTAPTMPANYTHKRRIGSIVRLSGAIVLFIQKGIIFNTRVREWISTFILLGVRRKPYSQFSADRVQIPYTSERRYLSRFGCFGLCERSRHNRCCSFLYSFAIGQLEKRQFWRGDIFQV